MSTASSPPLAWELIWLMDAFGALPERAFIFFSVPSSAWPHTASPHAAASQDTLGARSGLTFFGDCISACSTTYTLSAQAFWAKDWTTVDVPTSMIGELILDRVLALFCKVDMQLLFSLFLGATDASTEYGHGGVVSHADIDTVRHIARMACKAGGHACVGDGPE